LLLSWSIFLFGYGISTGTLYRTEALRAIIGREALQGAWLAPTLYGEPFLTKPPGMYVAIALASAPFGDVTNVSARLPSALAATITVFLFFATFRRVVDRKLALAGAMLMPVSLLWLDKAPSAEIDMLQLMWVSAAMLCFLRALELEEAISRRSKSRAAIWWFLSLLCITAGFLTKWTAPAFFYLTAIALLIWRRQLRLLVSWRHLVAVGISAGVCAGWAFAVADQTGWPMLTETMVAEASQRFHPHHNGKPYPWAESLCYPFAVLGANLPWSLLALFALRPSFARRWDENGRRLLQLLHCWSWPNLLFWSLPAQHHVRYSLPICPGIVGLGVMVLLAWARETAQGVALGCLVSSFQAENPAVKCTARVRRKSSLESFRNFSPRVAFFAILAAWCCVKLVFVEAVVPNRTSDRRVRETAARIAELAPPGHILYLCKLKDEGILFYYNRPARRFQWENPVEEKSFALLIESEWRQWSESGHFDLVERFRDQQGAPIYLVRFR
jgi:4-amino-4-deoxy-L-arabinose transferase-like glycosyltransferase